MLIIPIQSELYQICAELTRERRMLFVTGLPGVGKSLLIQQLTLIAARARREVHLLQWDISRQPFETPTILARYPEIDGVTDPMIRKAIGTWSRQAVVTWHHDFSTPEHLLIGELPLIGNRLSELIEAHDDAAEALLSVPSAEFVVPVPSKEVRTRIEAARARTIANPQHEKEKLDAPPTVLQSLWQEVNRLGRRLELAGYDNDTTYSPALYAGVYQALLQHRHHRLIPIEEVLRPQGSVYDEAPATSVLAASIDDATRIVHLLEATTASENLRAATDKWYEAVLGGQIS